MKKKDWDEISFLQEEEEQDFKNLMNFAGIKPIEQNTTREVTRKELEDCEPLIFDEAEECLELPDLSPSEKVAVAPQIPGKKAQRPARSVKRRKKKVNRNLEPDATLDLHGETSESALAMLEPFLNSAAKQNLQVLLIITGKGLNSGPQGSVLKGLIWDWLRSQSEKHIHGFQWAPAFLGGNGAILVFL